MNHQEAIAAWQADAARFEQLGVSLYGVQAYATDDVKHNLSLAMDAHPALATTPNSGVPAYLTTFIDPKVIEIRFAPNKAAVIAGETRVGSWTDETAMFPVVEYTGEVSSYGDHSNNGRTGINSNWPQRQAYRYQTIKEYGQLELERAGLAKIDYVSKLDLSAANTLNKFENYSYFFGVAGLQNYGLLNDPNLSASITPATKAAGGTAWVSGGQIKATANEVYADIEAIFLQLVTQTGGLVEATDRMVLAMSPASAVALTATNTFNVNVYDLLKKNFPNMRVETAVQYGAITAQNPEGIAAGNLVQLIVESIEGQEVASASYAEKMRSFPIIPDLSSFKQKMAGSVWGTVIKMPVGIASMVGV